MADFLVSLALTRMRDHKNGDEQMRWTVSIMHKILTNPTLPSLIYKSDSTLPL